MINRLSLPQGVKDYTPEKAEELRRTEEGLLEEFARWGYRKVITPLFEYLDPLSIGLGDELKSKVMKFVDPSSGDVVALRPDITPQVGRIVATQLKDHAAPLRLCYNGRVVRFEEKSSGKEREIFQAGCELVGLGSAEADAEIIALGIKSLGKSGIKNLVLDIGHTGILRHLLAQTGEHRKDIEDALKKKDQEALSSAIKKSKATKPVKDAISMLPSLFGGMEVLNEAKKIRSISKYVVELENVISVIGDYQSDCDINIDLGEIRGFNYYTGVTFEILSRDIQSPLVRGGRYDELMGKYGHDAPATGFAVDVESLLSTHRRDGENNQIHFVVIPKKPGLRREAIRLAEWLRSSGFKVVLDLNLDKAQMELRIKENRASNFYGVILLETPSKLKLIESRRGACKEFSNLEELLKGGI
ncbi:MAG TPA: ATP phosphoribosyltransferase regulatory subunit [Thermodesulfobacteriota bacterium]|nr:ATP phosphoribosyltransferase regulatory subunit [Thermodesulfobacteriota bacterium]